MSDPSVPLDAVRRIWGRLAKRGEVDQAAFLSYFARVAAEDGDFGPWHDERWEEMRDVKSCTVAVREALKRNRPVEEVEGMWAGRGRGTDLRIVDGAFRGWREGGRRQEYRDFLVGTVLEDAADVVRAEEGEEGVDRRRREAEGRDWEDPWKEEWNVVDSGFRVFGGDAGGSEQGGGYGAAAGRPEDGGTMRDDWEPFKSGFKIF